MSESLTEPFIVILSAAKNPPVLLPSEILRCAQDDGRCAQDDADSGILAGASRKTQPAEGHLGHPEEQLGPAMLAPWRADENNCLSRWLAATAVSVHNSTVAFQARHKLVLPEMLSHHNIGYEGSGDRV